MVNIVLIATLLELTLFNMHSYRLDFGNYVAKKYEINDLEKEEYLEYLPSKDTYLVLKNATLEREIDSINEKVGTITIQVKGNDPTKYTISYVDESGAGYQQLPSKVVVDKLENSKSYSCFFSGKTEKIKVELELIKGQQIKLESIQINKPISFQFHWFRYITVCILLLFFYSLWHVNLFAIPYDSQNRRQKVVVIGIALIFIGLLYWTCQTSINTNKTTYGSFYTEEFVDSLIKGNISLEEEPSKELQQLENPYDKQAREENEVEAKWDVAYYKGKYYVYFGILPALLLLVPYKLITNQYMTMSLAVFLFGLLATIFTIKAFIAMYQKWFSKVPFKLLIVAILGILMGSFLLWLTRRPDVYELVLLAGYYFVMQGIYLLFKAIEKESTHIGYLMLSCLSLALSVACRPTFLLVSIIILPMLWNLLQETKNKKKRMVLLITSIVIPYAVVGIGLMIYNGIRFDNVLQFGARYQITVGDMRNLGYRIWCLPNGLFSYFLKVPLITSTFPFWQVTQDPISFPGFYYNSPMAGGIVMLNPVLLVCLLIPKLKKHIPKQLFQWIVCLLSVGLGIAIVNIVMGGNVQRYAADYTWMFLMSAMLLLFIIYEKLPNQSIKKDMFTVVLALVMYSCIANFFLCAIQSENKLFWMNRPQEYYFVRYSIAFWE